MKRVLCFLWLVPVLFFSNDRIVSLGDQGSIRYIFEDDYLVKVERLSTEGKVIYFHEYIYDADKKVIEEKLIGGLGSIYYDGNHAKSPFHEESFEVNEKNQLVSHKIDGVENQYAYNEKNELITEETKSQYRYDEKGNLVEKDGLEFFYNEKNQLSSVEGKNLIVRYNYDDQGRRIRKSVNGIDEYYFYLDKLMIGVADRYKIITELRIPGAIKNENLVQPIAIETEDAIYAPIHNIQGSIIKLINIDTKEVVETGLSKPFGNTMRNKASLWSYAGKYCDREAGLVFFGSRYYSPELMKWITPDPLNQCEDPYKYCFNNPFKYYDPDGNWAVAFVSLSWYEGLGLALASPFWGSYAAAAGAGVLLGYGAYKAYEYIDNYMSNPYTDPNKDPPFTWDDLGDNPEVCPGKGFKWRGRGDPKSRKGNWVKDNEDGLERLYPDLDHPEPVGPHWDYYGPRFPNGVRIKPDGTWENK